MEDSSSIFDKLLEEDGIFENKEILRPSYTPNKLPHRSKQVNEIARILVPALKGETPSNILIYGKTGTGKTVAVKHVGRELEKKGEELNVDCSVIYLNCKVVDTQYRALAHIARHFDKDVPLTGWPTDQVYHELKDALDERKKVATIMLDEIDRIIGKSGDDILYNLSRINSDLERSKVSIIGISNDLKFTEVLDPRIKSSLGEEDIIFPPYNADQLRDILQQRAERAIKEGAINSEVIPLCAAFAAQEHGDARRALDLLRVSGELAEKNGETILPEHVRKAQEKIELDRVLEVVRTLPTQSKAVLLAIVKHQECDRENLTTGEVYEMYKKLARKIDIETLTQRRITDLISELDMLGIINAVVVSKGRYGRTKEISMNMSTDEIQNVLLNDYRLQNLKDYCPSTQSKL
ncbi:ORC1-type DNA replication protein [Methanonatronarchaeum sp. AMET-Sl]|uniref:ORC1-type DNA replication protein n=1 Tax=Methanonatronarchaeum sp. AMET-Sl TaxID=3037654 RepID=UPI00244E16B5|nr:ORC1-type DNA replication protein [Methanonatronarchaeum sp. AMET-Sl]WGI17733.1 ORC1-type DNA replication protein [Methanonatronarchaeum sp. AMET-Sl]